MVDSNGSRYRQYGPWLTALAGCKVQKISINAGFTCPNRDGTVGTGGCTYCNNQTFNPAYCKTDRSITAQLEEGKRFFGKKYPDMKYLAYFQAYTNTYGSLTDLVSKYEEALKVDGVIGLVIGTRPDCMPDELLNYLDELNRRCLLIVEYGIESTDDTILRSINRGHDFRCAANAVERTAAKGIHVGAHIILGLPGSNEIPDYITTEARRLSALPLSTIKIHQLQLIRGTSMATAYGERTFHLYSVDEYIDTVINFLENSRPDLVFERFVSQSPSHLLAVPGWGLKNFEFMHKLEKRLAERGSYQGKSYGSNIE